MSTPHSHPEPMRLIGSRTLPLAARGKSPPGNCSAEKTGGNAEVFHGRRLPQSAAVDFRLLVVLLTVTATVGCQTPNPATTVAAPATGMIGQPAQYGSWATPPQGAAYPPTVSAPPIPGTTPHPTLPPQQPMPGPATQWQSASPTTAPPANSWSWSQPSTTAPPTLQQYGTQLQNPPAQPPQNMTAQAQQYANQMQAQPQQWANQTQQVAADQQQQFNQQLQNTVNQYQQGFNNQYQQANGQVQQQMQAAQQQMNNGYQQVQQQVTAQMPQYQAPPPANSWNPFATSASSMPPARATPSTSVPRY